MNVEENFRRQYFHLEVHLVTNATRESPGSALLAAEAITEQGPLPRQRLLGGRDFRDVNLAMYPRDDMAGTSNAHGNIDIVARNLTHGEDIKQLRMQGPSIELENQVADPRSQ